MDDRTGTRHAPALAISESGKANDEGTNERSSNLGRSQGIDRPFFKTPPQESVNARRRERTAARCFGGWHVLTTLLHPNCDLGCNKVLLQWKLLSAGRRLCWI